VKELQTRRYRDPVRALVVILLASAVAGCGGGEDDAASPATTAAARTTAPAHAATTAAPEPTATTAEVAPKTACEPGEVRRVGTMRRAFAAVVQERAVAFRSPGKRAFARFEDENANGVPTVFSVLAKRLDGRCRPTWYRVQLPLKPNGVTGWVRAAEVQLTPIYTRIHVDLSERRVTLFERGRKVLSAPAAIGAPGTPTPTGRFYVNQRLVPSDPSGPFGPGAIGISSFSEVLTGWTQGGPIAIHGTNRPDLIGREVSNGCIRVRNDLLQKLFDRTLAGTPVIVRA
jgi:lipoprotein-anchoring transpeptidase ErfK/SrfK